MSRVNELTLEQVAVERERDLDAIQKRVEAARRDGRAVTSDHISYEDFGHRATEHLLNYSRDAHILSRWVDDLREQLREAEDVADKAALDGYENGLEFAEAEAETTISRLTDALRKIVLEWHEGTGSCMQMCQWAERALAEMGVEK